MPENAITQPSGLQKDLQRAFEGLSDKELGALYSLAKFKRLNPGEYLIREGDTDQVAYVILEGTFKVVKDLQGKTIEVATLGQGDWVGEIAFLQRIRRTASAVAQTPANVMVIDQPTLNTLEHNTQLFFYRRLNDLAAQRALDLSDREMELAAQNLKLIEYIRQARGQGKANYGQSEVLRGVIGKLPRLPVYAASLAARLLDENVQPGEISEAVKSDPTVASLVLKTVNSPVYGFKKPLEDIHQAMLALGFVEVYLLVLAEAVMRTMPDRPLFRQIYDHCAGVSRLAWVVAQESASVRPAEAATVGLLFRLGEGVVQLLKDKNQSLSLLISNLDPNQIGALLLREWQLPERVLRVVEHQDGPEFSPPVMIPEDVRTSAAALYFAKLLYQYLTDVPEREMPLVFFNDYAKALGWEGLALDEIADTRIVPSLARKVRLFPASFRTLLQKNKKVSRWLTRTV